MPRASDYVAVQYEVAKLIDSDEELSTEEFVEAAREERAISMLQDRFGDVVDLSGITSKQDTVEEMEKELSAAVNGNTPDEYGIVENGFAGYVVHLTEMVHHEAQYS
ncbi:hypothetical protein IL252_16870 [Halomicrobium sp. IBSBa]|uniref:hypothetical protein n=1 Tax=Halomicrobium sp. IBSBa TaxID=2778916 RepID=UPI001AC007A2|nr:hypothetical protein [Halomicrobium sp. IBSBa]MBO4249482.1 hypothetical protein [Halomicrobium sp. IBSBa]